MTQKSFIIFFLSLLLILASGFAGCTRSSQTDQFDGSQWRLITLEAKPVVAGSYISLYLRNGTVWGSSGINIFGGEYALKGSNGLAFSDIMSTLIGGPGDLAQQEENFFKSVRASATCAVSSNNLEIFTAEGLKVLVFERLPEYPMNPADLIGTKWQLVSLNGQTLLEGLSISLNFDKASQASGLAGCFAYQLPYEGLLYKPKGDDLRWGIISGRVGGLPQELEFQALHYTDSISWAANYLLTRDQLQIFTARGEVLVFKPSTSPSPL